MRNYRSGIRQNSFSEGRNSGEFHYGREELICRSPGCTDVAQLSGLNAGKTLKETLNSWVKLYRGFL